MRANRLKKVTAIDIALTLAAPLPFMLLPRLPGDVVFDTVLLVVAFLGVWLGIIALLKREFKRALTLVFMNIGIFIVLGLVPLLLP